MSIRMRKVFVPGGQPDYTYVNRQHLNLEARLREASDNLCKLVTVTGPTKCGKSVLTQKVYSRSEHVWIDGGSVSQEDDLWSQVLDQLNGFTVTSNSTAQSTTAGVSGELSGKAGIPFVIEGSGKVAPSISRLNSTGTSESRTIAVKPAALNMLRQSRKALVIDDFHYLPREAQGSIVRAVKALVFDGFVVILIAIPHRRYDAIRVEKEMTGRVHQIELKYWDKNELLKIPESGFPLLNVRTPASLQDRFASESLASPHLMQEFCRELCTENGIEEMMPDPIFIAADTPVDGLFGKVAEHTSKTLFERLAQGPRQRSDRHQRAFKSGKTADIYVAVLHAIAHLKPGIQTVEYEEIRSALRELLVELPQAHEVSRVLEHMSTIQGSEESSAPVLDWEKTERRLHIIDPFFAFFLRWGAPEIRESMLKVPS